MSVNIHGREYVTVAERVKEFRKLYPNYSMVDEIIDYSSETITIKTSILCDGVVVATGIAREERNESQINKTSYVENAETSAWGRALANLGIGIDSEVASANEVALAIEQQEKQTPINYQPKQENTTQAKYEPNKAKSNYQSLLAFCNENNVDKTKALEKANTLFNGKKINDLTEQQYNKLLIELTPSQKYSEISFSNSSDEAYFEKMINPDKELPF